MQKPIIKSILPKTKNRMLTEVAAPFGELFKIYRKILIKIMINVPRIYETIALGLAYNKAQSTFETLIVSGSSFLKVKNEHPPNTPNKNAGILAYGFT